MAAESIGNLVPTKIPGLSDQADIQAALRLYHYGSYNFDTAETDPAELVNPSIAYTINDLQDQIDDLSGGSAIQETSFNAKGDLLSASANDTLAVLPVGSNGRYLTANSATATGLEWTTIDLSTTLRKTDFDAKGDLLSASADNTLSVLPVGTNGQALVADSTTTSGLKWTSSTGFGKIVQIVRGSTTSISTASITTNDLVSTGLSATITPTSASNQILIFVNQNGIKKAPGGTVDFSLLFRMNRGATQIGTFGGSTTHTESSGGSAGDVGATFIDSPATTSAVTYNVTAGRTVANSNGINQTGFITFGWLSGESTLLLMEVRP
jgi:hypothetical protein